MEKAKFPMPTMAITQGYDEGTHKGAFALDLAGEDAGIDWILAPFTGTIKRVDNASYGVWYWFESNDEVLCANGEITKLTAMFGHDNFARHKVGDVIKQGERLCLEGTSGNATGNHCHFELGKGKFVSAGWYKNSDGIYMIYNAVKPNEYLCIPDNYEIKNNHGYEWRKESEVVMPKTECDQILNVGSTIEIRDFLTVTDVDARNNLIGIKELTGITSASWHWFDPTPFDVYDKDGNLIPNQVCYVGCKVKLKGQYQVQGLIKTSDWACKLRIGNRINWVWCGPCYEVKD